MLIGVVSALQTVYNPFTGKLDYFGINNQTNFTNIDLTGALGMTTISNETILQICSIYNDSNLINTKITVGDYINASQIINAPVPCSTGYHLIHWNGSTSTCIIDTLYNDSWIQPVIDLKVDIINGSITGLSNISGLYSCQNISGAVIQTVNYSRALEFCS